MEGDSSLLEEATAGSKLEVGEEGGDLENNTLHQPLLKRNRTLSSNPLALVGAKVSHIESLDYE